MNGLAPVEADVAPTTVSAVDATVAAFATIPAAASFAGASAIVCGRVPVAASGTVTALVPALAPEPAHASAAAG